MPVYFDEKQRVFQLDGKNTSYVFGAFEDHDNYIQHMYYGAKIPRGENLREFHSYGWHASFISVLESIEKSDPDRAFLMGTNLFEYPTPGTGDYRETAVSIENKDGNCIVDLHYTGYKIIKGKPRLTNLPSLYGTEDNAETLEVYARDAYTGAEVALVYTVFSDSDAIVRSARIKNGGKDTLTLRNALSSCLELPTMGYDFISLWGQHNQERSLSRVPLMHGVQSIESRRGASGHFNNPFVALAAHNADEQHGDVYGFNVVYSGNFRISAEASTSGTTRVLAGMGNYEFAWELKPGDEFQTPEVVQVFSSEGLGGMSRTFHKLYMNHLIPANWAYRTRPLLINSWEAAYFRFDTEKLLAFAEEAKALGMEMLVMDDGWFGRRDNDRCSLGDWQVNEKKVDLKRLTEKVHEMGLKFGIWYEPEMINPDSDLYRAHPDWIIHVPGRAPSLGRHQYVLDFSRKEVRDNIFEQMSEVLSNYKIDYVKWDFNRNITEAGSAALDARHSGEFFHRYMLGLYEFLDKFVKTFPDILLESCSGGGGRFDAGWLCYSPQIWCSDNTNPINRCLIQYGTSLCYPASTMGAHVSHKDRVADYVVRGDVAMAGTFGYELDPRNFSDEEKEIVKQQIADYHKYYDLTHYGDLYRICSPYDGDASRYIWSYVSEDKKKCLLTAVAYRRGFNASFVVRLQGLDPDKTYVCEKLNLEASGARLMNAGLNFCQDLVAEGFSRTYYFEEK